MENVDHKVLWKGSLQALCNKYPKEGRFIQDAWLGTTVSGEKFKMSEIEAYNDNKQFIWKRHDKSTFVSTVAELTQHVLLMYKLRADELEYFKYPVGDLGFYCIDHPEKNAKVRKIWGLNNTVEAFAAKSGYNAEWICDCGKTYRRTVGKQIESGSFLCKECLKQQKRDEIYSFIASERKEVQSGREMIDTGRQHITGKRLADFGKSRLSKLTMDELCIYLGDFGDLIFNLFTGVADVDNKKVLKICTVKCQKQTKMYWCTDSNDYVYRSPYEQIKWMVENIIGVQEPQIECGTDLLRYADMFKREKEALEGEVMEKSDKEYENTPSITIAEWCEKNPDLADILLSEWTGVNSTGSNGWLSDINNLKSRTSKMIYWRHPQGGYVLKNVRTRIRELEEGNLELNGDIVGVTASVLKHIKRGIADAEKLREKLGIPKKWENEKKTWSFR